MLMMLACKHESKLPEGGTSYDITVTATKDECHPAATEGYEETFTYYIALDGSTAGVYIDEQLFASGTVSGCTITYQTPIIGEESEQDGDIKWQLFGQADFDDGSDACVAGDKDWAGTEYFEIVATENDSLEPGCQYLTDTSGTVQK